MEVEEVPQENAPSESLTTPPPEPEPNPLVSEKSDELIAAAFGYTVVPGVTMIISDMLGAWWKEQWEGVNDDGTPKPFTENPGLKAIIPVIKIGIGVAGIYGVHRTMSDSSWAPIGYGAFGGVAISGISDAADLIMDAFEDMNTT